MRMQDNSSPTPPLEGKENNTKTAKSKKKSLPLFKRATYQQHRLQRQKKKYFEEGMSVPLSLSLEPQGEAIDRLVVKIEKKVSGALDQFEEKGTLPKLEKWKKEEKKEERMFADGDYAVKKDPRVYQVSLFEKAKKKNIIVYLATGMGKTLIGILLMKHYLGKSGGKEPTLWKQKRPSTSPSRLLISSSSSPSPSPSPSSLSPSSSSSDQESSPSPSTPSNPSSTLSSNSSSDPSLSSNHFPSDLSSNPFSNPSSDLSSNSSSSELPPPPSPAESLYHHPHDEKKWIIFLTSSVPLVLQQTDVIRANIGSCLEGKEGKNGKEENGKEENGKEENGRKRKRDEERETEKKYEDVISLHSCFDASEEWKAKLRKSSVLVMTHGVLDQVSFFVLAPLLFLFLSFPNFHPTINYDNKNTTSL